MLISKLLRTKRTYTKENGDLLVDLISSSFNFEKSNRPASGYCIVLREEQMRPDLVAIRIYGNHNLWEALLKYNGISNPFSIKEGQFLLAPAANELDKLIVAPKLIEELGVEKDNQTELNLLDPRTREDKKSLEALRNNVREVVPPNVNTKANKNIKIRDGRVIFGEDVTSINKENCSTPISRTRLIQQLIKSNLL